jgi:hypothetical protein
MGGDRVNRLTKQIIVEAHKWIGVVELKRNSGPEIDEWLRRVRQPPGAPWCAAFAWCMLDDAIKALGLTNPLRGTASVHTLIQRAHQHHAWWPEPGPGYIFGIDHGAGKGHCGIVLEVLGDSIATIEGNTGRAGEREGKYVLVRSRRLAECDLGYLDPGMLCAGQTCSEAHPEDG